MNTVILILTFTGFNTGGVTVIDFTHPLGLEACERVGYQWLERVNTTHLGKDSFYMCINKYKKD